MSIKKFELIKSQLMGQNDFLFFCNNDDANDYNRVRMSITTEFLEAVENDGFVAPLLIDNGTKLYSPHQIFVLCGLRKNYLNELGQLSDPKMANYDNDKPIKERRRYIGWFDTGYCIKYDDVNFKKVFLDFNKFLNILHSLPQQQKHLISPDNRRLFQGTPILEYIIPDKTDINGLLITNSTTVEELSLLGKNIASCAMSIDPLCKWADYILKHKQAQKDLLSGDASLAQELYSLYVLIFKIVEGIGGNRPPSLASIVKNAQPFLSKYLKDPRERGLDTKAIKNSLKAFLKWVDENSSNSLINQEIIDGMLKLEAQLDEFILNYGEMWFGGNVFNDLDLKIKPDQLVGQEKIDYIHLSSGKDDDGQKLWWILHSKLSDLQRNCSSLIRNQIRIFEKEVDSLREKSQGAHSGKIDPPLLPNETGIEVREKIIKFQEKIKKEIAPLEEALEGLYPISIESESIYCSNCRNNVLFAQNKQWYDGNKLLCLDCFEKIQSEFLSGKAIQNNSGDWKCNCGKLLAKFVYDNSFSTKAQNQVEISIRLAYGKQIVKARCPDCNALNTKEIEWGWT